MMIQPDPKAPQGMGQVMDEEGPEFGRADSEIGAGECPTCLGQGCAECGGTGQAGGVDAGQAQAAREQKLQELGASLMGKFSDVERKRQYIETRWIEDLRQYHGRYDPSVEKDLAEAESCGLFLNITKPKTHAFSARVMDMVLPTDELNWGLEPTPVPEMVGKANKQNPDAVATHIDDATGQPAEMATPEGAPVLEKDILKGVKDEAKARCDAMEEEIDDQLEEAKYNGLQRQAIEQMAKLGTGIIMGPVIVDEWRVKWEPQPRPAYEDTPAGTDYVRTLVPNLDKRPSAQWVDCWNFYPDMSSADPEGWEFAFVQYLINSSQLRKFAKRFNFMEEPTRQCLTGAPFNVQSLRWMTELKQLSETQNIIDARHRLLRFYGELEETDLAAVGIDPEALGLGETVKGVVWLCDGIVLKVDINPLDSGEMPFNMCYTDKDEASPFGQGIPRLMRGEQESVNAAWRMKHDNAGLSVCPQIVMRANAVTPADGDYHMKPKKLWYVGDEVQRVSDVFAQFPIDSHQAELDNILQLAIRFADDVTQLPLLMQGDQAPHITQTAQGMSLLYNASTVVLRRTVKFYDDYMTVPLVGKFYEWNMQFNPREDIKGDFRSIARGSSTLLDKEQQGQALDAAMQMAMQPTWQPYFDMEELLSQAMKIKRIPETVMLDPEQVKKNLADQQAAAQAAAQQGAAAAPPPDPLAQAKIDLENQKLAVKREEISMRERTAAADIASREGISITQAQARIAAVKVSEDAANTRFNAEIGTKLQLGSGI